MAHVVGPYVQALSDIARALRQTPAGDTVAWRLELLPGQVDRELSRLRSRVKELERPRWVKPEERLPGDDRYYWCLVRECTNTYYTAAHPWRRDVMQVYYARQAGGFRPVHRPEEGHQIDVLAWWDDSPPAEPEAWKEARP